MPDARDETVRKLIERLDLERYKATNKGLTQFGDRRQGTERNRKAVDWIEAPGVRSSPAKGRAPRTRGVPGPSL
jgi:hypothetical protein